MGGDGQGGASTGGGVKGGVFFGSSLLVLGVDLETQIPSVGMSRSWNPDPDCSSVEVLKPRVINWLKQLTGTH
jgi:hypothetical protein